LGLLLLLVRVAEVLALLVVAHVEVLLEVGDAQLRVGRLVLDEGHDVARLLGDEVPVEALLPADEHQRVRLHGVADREELLPRLHVQRLDPL